MNRHIAIIAFFPMLSCHDTPLLRSHETMVEQVTFMGMGSERPCVLLDLGTRVVGGVDVGACRDTLRAITARHLSGAHLRIADEMIRSHEWRRAAAILSDSTSQYTTCQNDQIETLRDLTDGATSAASRLAGNGTMSIDANIVAGGIAFHLSRLCQLSNAELHALSVFVSSESGARFLDAAAEASTALTTIQVKR